MFAQMLPWVSIAPFGVPVVPPVYCNTARSDDSIVTRGRSAAVDRRQQIGERGGSVDLRRRGGGSRVFGQRRHDDRRNCGLRLDALDERRQRVEGDDRAYARIRRDDERFARRVTRVDVDDDRAEAKDGERRDDVLRAVRQHDADAVALGDARLRERCRERIRAALQVQIGQLCAEELRGRRVRTLDGRECEDVIE